MKYEFILSLLVCSIIQQIFDGQPCVCTLLDLAYFSNQNKNKIPFIT